MIVRMASIGIVLAVTSTAAVGVLSNPFQGLDALTSGSSQIVIGMVQTDPPGRRTSTFNDAQLQSVSIVRTLKGDLAVRTDVPVVLQSLFLWPIATEGAVQDFLVAHCYVLFLHRDRQSTWRQINVAGSAFWVPCAASRSPASTAPVGDQIVALVRQSMAAVREQRQRTDQAVERYLAEGV
jgi:hypothetical protein